MKSTFGIGCLAALLLSAPCLALNDLFVDALLGDDALGNGSASTPYRTVTRALLDASGPGPTAVHLAPGTYNQGLGETFPLVLGPSVSLLGAGAYHCVISGGGGETLVSLGRNSLLCDLSLRRGGIAVLSQGQGFASPELRVLRRVQIQDSTIGIKARDALHSDHAVVLLNSALTRNATAVDLETTGFDFQSVTLAVHGSSISGNEQWLKASGIGELYMGIFGSIVYGNGSDLIPSFPWVYPGIQGNLLGDPGFNGVNGNLLADPLFAALPTTDLHLTAQSPALDWAAGNLPWPPKGQWIPDQAWTYEASYAQTLDLGGAPRLVGAASDAGAYERAVPTLYSAGSFALGESLAIEAQGEPSDSLFLGLSLGVLPAPLFGFLWLGEPLTLLGLLPLNGAGLGSIALGLPNNPSAVGLYAYFQAAALTPGGIVGSLPLEVRLTD
jgi:Protein of unknown function (DUF1565)